MSKSEYNIVITQDALTFYRLNDTHEREIITYPTCYDPDSKDVYVSVKALFLIEELNTIGLTLNEIIIEPVKGDA